MRRVILHSDMNNFYASVECLYRPDLRGKPLAVSGNAETRHGIILAKNEMAKRFGVQTGETLWQAKQKCRELVVVPPNYGRYLNFSKMAREIYADYTDQVESFGLDECWLDVSGSTALFGTGKQIADQIRERIKIELGITASVGVSFNKIFAKLGSDMKKPDATTVILPEQFKEKVWPLPVNELLYVGRATHRKLRAYGINTIGDLATADSAFLRRIFGKVGEMLWSFANGLDNSPVSNIGAKSLIKSIGNSTTTPRDLTTETDMKIALYVLCESVSARLREQGFRCRTVQITLRDHTLNAFERQKRLEIPVCTTEDIFRVAFSLYRENDVGKPYRSVGVRACNLSYEETTQLSLYPEQVKRQKREQLEGTIDQLRNRFGHFIIQRGIMLTDPDLSAFSPKDDHIIHPEVFQRGIENTQDPRF